MAAESHTAAIDRIEAIVKEESIDCDFERLDGYLLDSPTNSDDFLEKEFRAASGAGLLLTELLPHCPAVGFHEIQCLRFPSQGQFHPLKYLRGLK